jgi:hypothetical protein
VDTTFKSIDQVLDEIVQKLGEYGG